ncbi:hypothetical protein LCGC14_2508860, partial [marine sediment metagenome]
IVLTRGRNLQETQRSNARNGDITKGKKIAVLINGGSASASEIVAGDSVRWRIADHTDYPQSEGWTLKYELVGINTQSITAVWQTSGDDKDNWGTAVAEGIASWQDTSAWQEEDVTTKTGRYLKVEIVDTEVDPPNILFGASFSPFVIFDVFGTEVPADVRQSRCGFRPIQGADRLRGLRRNAFY